MRLLAFDTECTTVYADNKGHPFDPRNKLVLLSTYTGQEHFSPWFHHTEQPHCGTYTLPTGYDLYVAFNAKFDMHWLQRECGIKFPLGSIWCCQVAEKILTRQAQGMPSLDSACARYGLPKKTDIVKTEYWDKGIDTDVVPHQILLEYGDNDSEITYALALKQIEEAKQRGMYELIKLHCMDLQVLQEMEWNGMLYDVAKSKLLSAQSTEKIQDIDAALRIELGDVLSIVSFDSPYHVSATLFGGIVKYKEPYVYVFKNGNSKVRQREKEMPFPRIIEPIKGSEYKDKPGYYSASAENIALLYRNKLSAKAKKCLDLLQERSTIEQLRSTYYEGIPKLFDALNWQDSTIHHSLNQTIAVTGRLSSSKPNLQNQSELSKLCFMSRYTT